MKTYRYFFRKRGQPKSEERTGLIEAAGFYDANSKAAEVIGKDHIVTRVIRVKEGSYGSIELPEEDL